MAYTQIFNYSELAKFFIESKSDLDSLEAPVGSTASLVDESKTWRMAPNGKWIEIGGGDVTSAFPGGVIKVKMDSIGDETSQTITNAEIITSEDEMKAIYDKHASDPTVPVWLVGVNDNGEVVYANPLYGYDSNNAYFIHFCKVIDGDTSRLLRFQVYVKYSGIWQKRTGPMGGPTVYVLNQ